MRRLPTWSYPLRVGVMAAEMVAMLAAAAQLVGAPFDWVMFKVRWRPALVGCAVAASFAPESLSGSPPESFVSPPPSLPIAHTHAS